MQTDIDTIIIGGTFNPVHNGHLHIADEVRHRFNPERILIIPSFISAHKLHDSALSAEHRLEMLRIATRNSCFTVEKCELERQGVSYTIDTIRFLKEKYRLEKKPGLLIGDDLVEGFKSWKNASAIAEEAQLIVAARDAEKIDFGYKHIKIDNLMLNISSSDIRKRVLNNEACRYLLPPGVYEYIIDNNLYGDI